MRRAFSASIRILWNSVDPLQRPSVFAISALAGIVLSFVLLRSVRIGLMVTVAARFTAIVTTSLIPAVGHTMNMVTIVMPTLVVVITISAAIHVVNYWRHAAASGVENPIQKAIQTGWWPCLLSNATTGIGLLSLSISRLGPIRDFGVFATIGTVVSFIVAIGGIPAMLRLSNARPGAKQKQEGSLLWGHIADDVASSADYLAAPKDPGFVWTHGAPLDETWRITAQGSGLRGGHARPFRNSSGDDAECARPVFSVTGAVPSSTGLRRHCLTVWSTLRSYLRADCHHAAVTTRKTARPARERLCAWR